MGVFPLDRIDDKLGDGVERLVRSHHRRRLVGLGHAQVFEPPFGDWAASGTFPMRPGNAAELLVDGAVALPRMVEEIERAHSHVHVAGWFFTPSFRMGDGGPTLRDLLADVARRVDVRVLVWAGAPLPFFHPDRSEVRAMGDELVRGTAIALALDSNERPMHCHHEKLVIVDDRVAFVGGIDLTTLAGDRLDHSLHPVRGTIGWHDACLRLEGPIVADVAAHFALRWRDVAGALPGGGEDAVAAAGELEAQLVRTVPERIYSGLPRGEFTIAESYIAALRRAERLVYLESQFLWSPELVSVLADKLREPPDPDFRVVVLLPARPNNGADDTRGQLGVLVDADDECDDGVGRLLACTLRQPGHDGEQVYVHAKVGIVDDRWLTVGSANLNEHSLFNDTEVNVVLRDPEFVRRARRRLWAEHLERDPEELDRDPCKVIDELWRPKVEAGAGDRRLQLLPHVSRRSRALLGPLNGLLVDG